MRIAITGYPNSGKTTLASLLVLVSQYPIRKTDELLETHEWSELSEEVSKWFEAPGPWIVEGVAVPRAIRKWRLRHPRSKPPFDMFIYIQRPFMDMRPGQRSMSLGLDTVMLELWQWLRRNKVWVFTLGGPDLDEDDA